MSTEIERKFLIHQDLWEQEKNKLQLQGEYLVQAYILKNEKCVVRVRIAGDQGYLTLKSRRENISCTEYEYSIPLEEAKFMLENFVQDEQIEKTRYKVQHEEHLWEVDEFLGDNIGLTVAEIELNSEEESFSLPKWVNKEVSKISKYFNSALSIEPYKDWKK